MFSALSFVPFLFLLIWLGLILYVIVLATRLVTAVERIAGAMTEGLPHVPRRES
jgi:hypothetical protein